MTRRTLFLLLVLALPAAAASYRAYVKATLVAIEQRSRDRVLLYQVNTPIMTVDHYLAVTVDAGGMRYEGEYMPRKASDPVPQPWQAGDPITAHLEKHYIFVKGADGKELKFFIVGKKRIPSESKGSQGL
jgi:hypothetical protein